MPDILDNKCKKAKETINNYVLVVSRTFFPKTGGIEEYVYNRCLQEPKKVILLAASYKGDREFDSVQPFITYRWFLPSWLENIKLGSLIKQILNIFWSFWLALKLHSRYSYKSLEWGHGYDFPSLLLLTYLLPVRFVVYLHGNDVLCPLRNSLFKSLFSLTLRRMDKIICNSSFTKDYLQNNFVFDTPIEVINPIVRPEKFAVAPKAETVEELGLKVRQIYQIPRQAIAILSVGRLVRRKGFDRVIKCLPALVAEDLDVHYLVCGKGEMESELRALTKSLGVEERVHFAGFVPDRELASYYAAADIFAMLTFLDTGDRSIEGFGIVYTEAGYFGKPVIASRVGGVVDAVSHRENGLLVNPEEEEEAVKALLELCRDRDLRESLGNRGRELAMKGSLSRFLMASVDARR